MFKYILLLSVTLGFTTTTFAATGIVTDYVLKPSVNIKPGKIKITPKVPTGGILNPFDIRNVGNGHGVSVFGIRNVGNGGGLAEMRLIYLHQNLDRFLQICLTKQNVCSLSSQTLTEWEKLVQQQEKDSNYYIISFVPKVDNQKGYTVTNQTLTVSSQMLYSELDTPKKFGELLAYIIAVRQDLAGSGNSFATNLQTATGIFKKLIVQESSYRATGLPSMLRVAQLKTFDGVNTHFLFSLEDKEKSVDLTERLSKSLPCGELSNWSFSQWSSSVASTDGYFYGMAQGLCDGKSVSQKIVLHFELDKQWKLNFDKIEINFFEN